ncbi:hypothetical protein DFS33DRAFT_1350575 [Desarmillaria ectypa]|nr:hypothetical protein DFS33DRAFT_1350575 [Desarmillaria ectypa]
MSEDNPTSSATNNMEVENEPVVPPLSSQRLKRRASSSFEGLPDDTSRKRVKGDNRSVEADPVASSNTTSGPAAAINGAAFVDELAQELQCGCCSELLYRPVIVSPCQHFFCGSCCMLWIRNGGTNCPACRGISTIVTPSRPLQTVIDVLLHAAPSKVRAERERQQADEIYSAGTSMRIPPPREASPEPNLNQSDYARPCPHCTPGNMFGYTCPQPVPDPDTDAEHAWHLDEGTPPGHANCGNCENLLALQAPTTTKCDFCQVSFCGIGVPGRCIAASLAAQQLHSMADLTDFVQSPEVYECFNDNHIEVDIMLDYLAIRRILPKNIYRDIVTHIQSQPHGFQQLLKLELFRDVHPVAAGTDTDPAAPRQKICRACATEVLLWGLKDWWLRERQKGIAEGHIPCREDCPEGGRCSRQTDVDHAKEFNHIFGSPQTEMTGPTAAPPAPSEESSTLSATEVSPGAPLASAQGARQSEGPTHSSSVTIDSDVAITPVPVRGTEDVVM